MFKINSDNSIYLTRGDSAILELTSNVSEYEPYIFQPSDIVRFKIFEKNKCDSVVVQKDFHTEEANEVISITLSKEDTKIGIIKSAPVDYWYEIELNPDTEPQTIIGYDVNGPKIFRLYPEGGDIIESNS